MAISFVGQAGAAATTVTIPAHNIGDYIIIFAYRTAATAPTVPAGYNAVPNGTATGNANSFVVGYKVATSTSDTSGTWTNATLLNAVVYRGLLGIGGAKGQTNAAALTAAIPAITMTNNSGSSWVVAFAGSKQATSQGTPLAGATTLRGTQTGTTSDSVAADTNAGVTSFSATTSANASSVTSSGVALELLVEISNYQVSNNISTSFNTGPQTFTWTHYNASTNPLLVMSADIFQDSAGVGTVTAATYNGTSMTKITNVAEVNLSAEMWYLAAPSSGANTVSITVTGATDAIKLSVATFDGFDQSSPLDTSNTSVGSTATNPTVSMTTGVANALVVTTLSRFSTTAARSNRTPLYNDSVVSTLGATSYQLATTTGSYSDTYTGAVADDWAMIIASFKPIVAPTSASASLLMMMGVG